MIPFETKEFFENMRPLVVDFDLSCLMRHAGLPQKTALYWHLPMVEKPQEKPRPFLSYTSEGAHCAAYTSEELSRLLDPSFTTIRVGANYVFLDLMACTVKQVDENDAAKGSGLVLHMVKGCEDKTEAMCKARGVLVLAGKQALQCQRNGAKT